MKKVFKQEMSKRTKVIFLMSIASSFSIQLTVNVQYEFLPMTGFEPQTSGIEATALPTELPPLPFRKQCYERLTVVIFDS